MLTKQNTYGSAGVSLIKLALIVDCAIVCGTNVYISLVKPNQVIDPQTAMRGMITWNRYVPEDMSGKYGNTVKAENVCRLNAHEMYILARSLPQNEFQRCRIATSGLR